MISPAASSRTRPTFRSRSGSEGSAAREAGYPALHLPSGGTCARQRQAFGLHRFASAPACRLMPDIRRGSSVVNQAEAALMNAQSTAAFEADDMPAAIGRRDMVFDRAVYSRPARNLSSFGGHPGEASESGRSVKFNSGSGFKGLHLSLHQRAGSPFRYIHHRATGPVCQGEIFSSFVTNENDQEQ